MTTLNNDTAMQATRQTVQPSRPSAKVLRLLQALDTEIMARLAMADKTPRGKPPKG